MMSQAASHADRQVQGTLSSGYYGIATIFSSYSTSVVAGQLHSVTLKMSDFNL